MENCSSREGKKHWKSKSYTMVLAFFWIVWSRDLCFCSYYTKGKNLILLICRLTWTQGKSFLAFHLWMKEAWTLPHIYMPDSLKGQWFLLSHPMFQSAAPQRCSAWGMKMLYVTHYDLIDLSWRMGERQNSVILEEWAGTLTIMSTFIFWTRWQVIYFSNL